MAVVSTAVVSTGAVSTAVVSMLGYMPAGFAAAAFMPEDFAVVFITGSIPGSDLGLAYGLGYPWGWGYYPPYDSYYGDAEPNAVAQNWYYCSNPAGYYPYVTQVLRTVAGRAGELSRDHWSRGADG